MVAANQSLVAAYRYDPFGRTTYSSGSLASANLYRFSSKPIHANSGLYYYGYRFYWPEWQRWINRDPIFREGDPNLYRFVENAPLCLLDSEGLRKYEPDDLDRAGVEAAKEAYRLMRENGDVEYCGRLCACCTNGVTTYSRTGPVRGTEKKNLPRPREELGQVIIGECNPADAPACPLGCTEVGSYHSHPRTPRHNPQDKESAYVFGRSYISCGVGKECTRVDMYDPFRNREYRID
jgi:RHS repeat-associated protein